MASFGDGYFCLSCGRWVGSLEYHHCQPNFAWPYVETSPNTTPVYPKETVINWPTPLVDTSAQDAEDYAKAKRINRLLKVANIADLLLDRQRSGTSAKDDMALWLNLQRAVDALQPGDWKEEVE